MQPRKEAGFTLIELMAAIAIIAILAAILLPALTMSKAKAAASHSQMTVFFATDRQLVGGTNPAKMFGLGHGDGQLAYGTCEVSIPREHRMGKLESPGLLRPDPAKHVLLLSVTPKDKSLFFSSLQGSLKTAHTNDVLIFIHGFANTFEDAARRTGQLSYDLGFRGVPIMYAWPSKGSPTPAGYTDDEKTFEWTYPHLEQFLREVSSLSKASRVHLIAHSMGNRVLGYAMERLVKQMQNTNTPLFSEIILAAPDVGVDVFKTTLLPAFRANSRRVTLYASTNDVALNFSGIIHDGKPRVGNAPLEDLESPDMDIVDASPVDSSLTGHSYYGDNRSVISDMFPLINLGLAPSDRNLLDEKTYWRFRP